MKTHTQEVHDDRAEYLARMQKGLGHHSWWYTNRSSDDCINVKMHCWVDTDEVMKLLTDRERLAVETLSINVDEWCDTEKWSDEMTNDCLLEMLQENEKLADKSGMCEIAGIEYGGRSGGWLAVEFTFDGLADYLEGYEYTEDLYKDGVITKKEWSSWCKQADEAVKYIEKVHAFIEKMHSDYCKELEQPEFYIDRLQEYVADQIDYEAEKILTATNKLKTLAK